MSTPAARLPGRPAPPRGPVGMPPAGYAATGPGGPAPQPRRWTPVHSRRVRTVLIVTMCFFTCTFAVVYADGRRNVAHGLPPASAEISGPIILCWLLGIGIAVLTVWRTRWPELLVVIGSTAALVLPLEPTPALVALTQLILRRRGPLVWGAGALASAATVVSVWRDSRGHTSETSFWQVITGATTTPRAALPWWAVAVISALVVAATIGIALTIRSRREVASYAARDEVQAQQLNHLQEEHTRQAERERLAQEVHDALGHRLSLLSLHAGALEVAAGDDKVARSAALVREGAQQSMDDLRSLLSMLREPGAPDVASRVPDLGDVPQLIDESLAAGSPVVASVYVDRSEPLNPVVSHTAYRIVQELLTNARKHAPSTPIRLQLNGSARTGIEISTANRVPSGRPEIPGATMAQGSGLVGISERVRKVGGRSKVWVDEEYAFRVGVWLPWHPGPRNRPQNGTQDGPQNGRVS
ncbi:sensor histidine kinase [Luteipulveratus flavus]|uniref:histidine kinase n=1 Tax=Luteipulveratus flavus TaxID=3031728 RepID=A0ABT6CAC1_9MICO|nr:histidine kinase [Luteipulveratus sp. YIM 133296]MDF8265468.1 histidine kinase [Luteipulveratus sp. YIM 133296]